MKTELLLTLLVIAMTSSVINCAFIQKTKAKIGKKWLTLYAIIVNMVLGVLFTITFTDASIYEGCWVGLFSFLGADTLYQSLEGKLPSYSDLISKKIEVIPRNDK